MSQALVELENLLGQLITEHKNLLGHVEAHQSAMKKLDLRQMEEIARAQELNRLRIAKLENRRRIICQQLGALLKMNGKVTLPRIMEAMPAARQSLGTKRAELKALMGQVQSKLSVAGRLAGAVLGHLNTVVRLMAGAVHNAGLYTRDGAPRVMGRVGVMEAVG